MAQLYGSRRGLRALTEWNLTEANRCQSHILIYVMIDYKRSTQGKVGLVHPNKGKCISIFAEWRNPYGFMESGAHPINCISNEQGYPYPFCFTETKRIGMWIRNISNNAVYTKPKMILTT